MPKSKEQKQEEAQARKLRTLPQRKQRLLNVMHLHHEDIRNQWTYNLLKKEIQGFNAFLSEVGLQSVSGRTFYIDGDMIVLTPDLSYRNSFGYKCPLCLQPYGAAHASPCTNGATMWPSEALLRF